MKARLVPLYFDPGRDSDFDRMLEALRPLLADRVELLDPLPGPVVHWSSAAHSSAPYKRFACDGVVNLKRKQLVFYRAV